MGIYTLVLSDFRSGNTYEMNALENINVSEVGKMHNFVIKLSN